MNETSQTAVSPTKRRFLQAIFFILLAIFIGLIGLFVRYVRQPAPLPQLIVPQADIVYPPHYLFSIYDIQAPVGVAVSANGERIYAAESAGDRLVQVYDRDGQWLGTLIPPRTRSGERAPVYLATDSNGRIFITDRLQSAIYVFSETGAYLDTLLDPELSLSEYVAHHTGGQLQGGRFSYNAFQTNVIYQKTDADIEQLLAAPTASWAPLGIRIDSQNQVWINDVAENSNCVRTFTLPDDPLLTTWHAANNGGTALGDSGNGPGEFAFPNAAMADSQGRVYVSDGNNGRISVWNAQGNFLFNFGSGNKDDALSLPRGLIIDERDRLYVVDAVAQNIRVFDVSGDEPVDLFTLGSFGQDDGLFNYPNDIAIDASGRLYIADRENNRIQVWSY
jgi:DNA-binding beta-propeller fold protein YncE